MASAPAESILPALHNPNTAKREESVIESPPAADALKTTSTENSEATKRRNEQMTPHTIENRSSDSNSVLAQAAGAEQMAKIALDTALDAYVTPTLQTWDDVVDTWNAEKMSRRWSSIIDFDEKAGYGFEISHPANINKPLLPSSNPMYSQGDMSRRPIPYRSGSQIRKRKQQTNLRSELPASGSFRMSPIEMLQHMGPDFMSNKFDCFFMWRPDDAKRSWDTMDDLDTTLQPPWSTEYERSILSHSGFAVRLSSIKIPTILQDTYDVPVLETRVRKIRSSKKNENLGHFSFRLDQDLVWLEQFQLLAGRTLTDNEFVKKGEKVEGEVYDIMTPIVDSGASVLPNSDYNFRHVVRTIAKTWTRKGSYDPRSMGLCLVVKMQHLENWVDERTQRKVLPYFFFENVNILGTGNEIAYRRDAAETIDIDVDFAFRRYYTVYPEPESSFSKGLAWNTNNYQPFMFDPESDAEDFEDKNPRPQLANLDSNRIVNEVMGT
jgi:hypothetical protein